MKKILVFHPTIAPYRIDFFNDLYRRYNAKIYLMLTKSKVFKNYEEIQKQFEFVPQYVFNKSDGKVIRSFNTRYWRILNEENPDVVITSEFGACPIMVLLHRMIFRKEYRVITMCDDSEDMIKTATRRHRLFRHICTFLMDDVITVAPNVCKWFKKKYGKGLYFPIIRDDVKARKDLESVLALSQENATLYGLLEKRVYLFVGRLAVEKNVSLLIRAFSEIKTEDDRLVIIGDGTEKPMLESLSNECGANAIFLGRIEGLELLSWYNIANVFVLPSIFEPFGAVTNEALIAGCYSIISSIAGSSSLIADNENGIVFNPHVKGELNKALISAREKGLKNNGAIVLKPNMMSASYKTYIDSLFNELDTSLV
jgi:glycosyltransferase involved in cell wall biosynthesis